MITPTNRIVLAPVVAGMWLALSTWSSAQTAIPFSGCNGIECVFSVGGETDDAGPNPDQGCVYATNWNEIYFGECFDGTPIISGFRFPNVSIPRGTKIVQAFLEFTVDGPYRNGLVLNIWAEATGDAQSFDVSPPDLRSTHPNFTVWTIPPTDGWHLSQTRRTPDLSVVVQKILDRGDWEQGQAMAFIVKNAIPANSLHRRVVAPERPTGTYSGDVARLVIMLECDAIGGFDELLSPIGQVVHGIVGQQNYCQNRFHELITLPPGQDAFEKLATEVRAAQREVDFVNMVWEDEEVPEDDTSGEPRDDSPMVIFLRGIRDLYLKVQADPVSYSGGVRVRILTGLQHILGFSDQRAHILAALGRLGIPLQANNWKVEVGAYRHSSTSDALPSRGTHSHVKMLIVDGARAFVMGYNMEYNYLNLDESAEGGTDRPTYDVGVKVSGPIVQDSLRVFDKLWTDARLCRAYDVDTIETFPIGRLIEIKICVEEDRVGAVSHAPEVQSIQLPTVGSPVPVFSLFRNHDLKNSDFAISAAVRGARHSINILQNRYFENVPLPIPLIDDDTGPMLYTHALKQAVRNGVQIRLLLPLTSKQFLDAPINVIGPANLLRQLKQEGYPNPPNLQICYDRSPIHAKVVSIDGEFLIVGSQNWDSAAFGTEENIGRLSFDLAEY